MIIVFLYLGFAKNTVTTGMLTIVGMAVSAFGCLLLSFSGILNMSRTIGMGLGVTAGGLSYQLLLHLHASPNKSVDTELMAQAFHGSFIVIGIIAVLALILSFPYRNTRNVQ